MKLRSQNLRGINSSGRPRRRWKDNNRTDVREIGWEVVDWIHLD
jgi:hypothetical protein